MSVIAPIASVILLAATPLSEVRVVPDTSATLGTTTVNDEDAAADNLSTVTLVSLGAIPPETAVDAYAVRLPGGQLVSFETTVVLPGGATARPGDVWKYEGGSYAVEFDAAARGVPATANLDAVALYAGSLLLSFDTAFDVGGLHVEPEDLIRFDGASFTTFFDGSAAGVAPGLDLDGPTTSPATATSCSRSTGAARSAVSPSRTRTSSSSTASRRGRCRTTEARSTRLERR
jgi:hypothetical protein